MYSLIQIKLQSLFIFYYNIMFDYKNAPTDEVFEDIKSNAIKIWYTYDNTYWYADEKASRIFDIPNYKDNVWYIYQMFDINNQMKLNTMVWDEAKAFIKSYRDSANEQILLDLISD